MFWIVEHITEARKELVDCESNKMYHGIELHRKPLSLIHREFYLIRLMQSIQSVYFYNPIVTFFPDEQTNWW